MRVVSKSRTIGLEPGSRSWIRLWSEDFTPHNSKILIWWTLSCLVILVVLWPNAQIDSKLLLEKEATSWLLLTVCFLPYCPNSEGHFLHLHPFFPFLVHENLSKRYKNMHYCDIFASSPWYCESNCKHVSLTTSVCRRILCDHRLIHSTLHCYHDCHMTANPELFVEEEDSQPVRRV